MSVIFMIVFLLVAVMIVGLVLLQEGKGGGLTGMSTGMDGVMGAKNPLRRMTAGLFVFFVLLCLGINWYFHQTTADTVVPQGLELPSPPSAAVPVPAVVDSPEDAVEAVVNAIEANEAAAPAAPEAVPAAPAVEAAPAPEAPAATETPAPEAAPATPAPAAETPAE